MPRPLIGVCAAVERADFGVWKQEPAVMLPLSYARAIHGAGGMMAMLPPDRRATEDPAELLDRLDALVLGGGADIDPESQGAEAHPETIGTNPDRDRFEIALAREALERGMPAARRLPWDADPQRRLRRDARSAPARPARPRAAPAGAGCLGRA